MSTVIVSIERLADFCRRALQKVGVSQPDATVVADALVMTDSWGVFTHGSKLLYDYVRRIQAGGSCVDQQPVVERQGSAWAVVQANSVMGQVAAALAMDVAIGKARKCGVSYVCVKNTTHFGAAGYYSWLAAREGMIGISMANDIPSVVAPGSKLPVTGSNPLSYAIPTGPGRDPILLDMAISTVAGGKVYAAHQRGEPIPNNWIVDRDGLPTTDGSLFPANAALQPMSGPKGYGIGLLIEALSGVISGAGMTWQIRSWLHDDISQPTNHGAAFLAIDVNTIMPSEEFQERMRQLIDEIHNTPATTGVDRVMLPGEREWRHRAQALKKGLQLPPDVLLKLKELSTLVEIPLEPFVN